MGARSQPRRASRQGAACRGRSLASLSRTRLSSRGVHARVCLKPWAREMRLGFLGAAGTVHLRWGGHRAGVLTSPWNEDEEPGEARG